MAQFDMSTADNYGGGKGSFFVLKNDKDKAQVRFLYDGMEDIKGELVHKVQVGDKERYVSCLRTYSDPIDKCPFCAAQIKVQPRLFLKLYNEDAGEVQIWERSKLYYQRLSGFTSRYKPLYNEIIEIERHGKAGDQQTDYQFFPVENTPIDITDEKYECPEAVGTIILDKTADDMHYYLENGNFPITDSGNANQAQSNEMPIRRTPSSSRRAF